MVTIKDIAQACGVSISTVSNVLNGKTNKVSNEIALKIKEEVKRTGYKPNYLARNLRSSSTRTIGVIAEDLIVFSSPAMIEGIMKVCEENNYNVVIENMRLFGRWHGEWLNNEQLFQSALSPVLTKMNSMNLDGVIYVGGHEHTVHNLVFANDIPVVMAYALAGEKKIPTFRLDDYSGGYDVIKYLVSMGHHKIGIIGGEYENTHTLNRILGAEKAMYDEGILFDPELAIYEHWNKKGGYDGMMKLMDKDITAVFCMSDMIAAGAYEALLENGRIPGRDISVMGYDNQEVSFSLTPAVTTMALPLEEIGSSAAAKVIEMIENPTPEMIVTTDVRIKSKLIERKSVIRVE